MDLGCHSLDMAMYIAGAIEAIPAEQRFVFDAASIAKSRRVSPWHASRFVRTRLPGDLAAADQNAIELRFRQLHRGVVLPACATTHDS